LKEGDEPLKERVKNFKKAFLPLLTASAISGFLIGVIIFLFRCAGEFVIRLSRFC